MREIQLPASIEIVQGPNGPRFKGPALAIRELAMSLRALQDAPLGSVYFVGPLEFYITNNPHDSYKKGRIALPKDAWNILASKFIEVTAGWEESPFDFRDCGYLFPEPALDIGVELVGEPVQD